MTVDHLRKTRGVHHVLYAYSPQDVSTENDHLRGYPGDEYVDVFGLDYYRGWYWREVPRFGQALSTINRLAAEHGKVAALTETGVDKVPNADWWTEYLLKALKHDEWSSKTAWALVWRNKSFRAVSRASHSAGLRKVLQRPADGFRNRRLMDLRFIGENPNHRIDIQAPISKPL